jgi:homoaconitase/3-isopropylmalate dehydratase large subunit
MHVYGDDPEAAAQRKQEAAVDNWFPKISAAKDANELNRISLEAIKAVRGNIESVSKIGQAKNARIKELREAAK